MRLLFRLLRCRLVIASARTALRHFLPTSYAATSPRLATTPPPVGEGRGGAAPRGVGNAASYHLPVRVGQVGQAQMSEKHLDDIIQDVVQRYLIIAMIRYRYSRIRTCSLQVLVELYMYSCILTVLVNC